ncbi:hypothetical protein A8B78_06500 [Jannaschia sp. EhC01]|nr:hypothetical protein A8B78_06500 [Jannaschia sp. EhC01]
MQALYIFRGCLAAYAAGVIVITLAMMGTEGDGPEAFGFVALFGLFALVPMLIITFVIWGVLVANSARVKAWQAVALCAAVFFSLSVLAGVADGELLALFAISLTSPLVGAAFGAAFWVGAFGFRKEMTMAKRMPEDWW